MRRAASHRSRSIPRFTARRSRQAFASGRPPCPRVLCFRSRGRASPPTGASSPRPATLSSVFWIRAFWSLASGSVRCSGNSRRPRNSTPPTSASSSSYCRRRPRASGCGMSSRSATTVFARRNSLRCCASLPRRSCLPTTPNIRTSPTSPAISSTRVCRRARTRSRRPTRRRRLDAWAGRLRLWAQGKAPDDLPRVDAASAPRKTAPRDVFAYVIHEGKIRAPAAAMALIERLKT